MRRTIKCRLAPAPIMADAVAATARAFAEAANIILGHSRRIKTSNKVKLQHAAYREIRKRFGLSANLTIRAIARVAWAIKSAAKKGKRVGEFRPTSVDYDQRIFAYREIDETVSVTTMKGRIHIPLKIGRYQREALAGKKPTCARIVKSGRHWDIHIVVDETEPPKRGGPPLGIDLGIKSIATLSTDVKISGAKIRAIKKRYAKIRASLQSKGTRGSKRVLRRLSGKERRFISWMNHRVSKDIVNRHADVGGFGSIRMEDLRGIRRRARTQSRHLNRMISGWSFGELQTFIRYKAERAGIAAETINPAYTSQTCFGCWKRGERNGDTFSCQACGTVADADINAAKVISAGGVEPGETPGDRNAARIVNQIREFFSRSA